MTRRLRLLRLRSGRLMRGPPNKSPEAARGAAAAVMACVFYL